MTATIFGLSVGLFSVVGFAVEALSFSVRSSPAQDAALLTAVGLASPARAAYIKEASAPTTLNPEQNRNLSRLPTWNLQPVGGSIKMNLVVRASDLFGGSWLKGSEIAAPSLTFHAPKSRANNADLRHFTLYPLFFRSVFAGIQQVDQIRGYPAIHPWATSPYTGRKRAEYEAKANISFS